MPITPRLRRVRRRPPSKRRIVVRFAVLALCFVVGAGTYIGVVASGRGRPVMLSAPSGPFTVGRHRTEWTDPARLDPTAPTPGTTRRLAVWMWYPAASTPGTARSAYAPGPWTELGLHGPLGLFQSSFDAVVAPSVDDAPAAHGMFPVVVLAPGLGFAAPQYQALAADLASRGYVVVGVTPTYGANLTVLAGSPVSSTPSGDPPDLGGHTGAEVVEADRLVQLWSADARFAAGRIAGDATGVLAAHVDHGPVTYIGHSFGGAAALQACHDDGHCAGAVDLDGTQFGSVVTGGLAVPALLVGSGDSCITGVCGPDADSPTADPDDRRVAGALRAASTGPMRCVVVAGARHFDFTDDSLVPLAAPVRWLYPLGPIGGWRAAAVTAGLVDAFLARTHVPGSGSVLDDPATAYPEVRRTC